MDSYFTIIIPWAPIGWATQWHPTEKQGPFAYLARGNFKSASDAIAWAYKNLNGCPYTIEFREGLT